MGEEPVGEIKFDTYSPAEIARLSLIAIEAFRLFEDSKSPATLEADGLTNVFYGALNTILEALRNGGDYGADTKIGRGDFGDMALLDVLGEVSEFIDKSTTGIANDVDPLIDMLVIDVPETEDRVVGDELILLQMTLDRHRQFVREQERER